MMLALLVEDNPGDAALIRHAVQNRPVDLEWCSDGEEALALLRGSGSSRALRQLPDLILLDLKMPGMGGFEFLERIKRDPTLRTISVVVLTSSLAASDITRAYELQAAACFAKPAEGFDEVVDRILDFFRAATPRPTAPVGATERTNSGSRPLQSVDAEYASFLIDSAAEAIVGLDLDGVITSWNEAAERLYGYPAAEAVGQPMDLIAPPERTTDMQEFLENVRKGATDRHLRTIRLDGDGREVHVELTLSPVRDETGRVIGRSAIARDYSEQWAAEQRFRLAVEAAPSAMIMVDAEGIIEMVNAETERMFSYDRKKLVGKPVETLVPGHFRARHPRLRAGFAQDPQFRAMGAGRELTALRRDGTEFPVEIGLNPIKTPTGLRVLCSVVDITARREAEEMFRIAVEASPSGFVMVDERGTIVLVNAEMERMFLYSRDELLGASIDVLVPPRFRGQHARHRSNFVAAPEARAMGSGRDLFGLRKDGTEFPVEIGLNPIRTDERVLILGTILDITARKRDERALRRQREELARSNAELEQFAYVASHDLQEPLRMVSSFTTLLAEHLGDDLEDEARSYIRFAQDGAARMRVLIQDLLSLARVRTAGKELVLVDLRRCAEAAVANLAVTIQQAGAKVEVNLRYRARGDESQLTSVFQNLLSNAIKFRGEDPPHVRVRDEDHPDCIRVVVEDNGVGIPSRHSARVFQLFQRLHPREKYPGTGIGLALCHRIIERHGGEIGVESDGQSGSAFYFTLPRGQNAW